MSRERIEYMTHMVNTFSKRNPGTATVASCTTFVYGLLAVATGVGKPADEFCLFTTTLGDTVKFMDLEGTDPVGNFPEFFDEMRETLAKADEDDEDDPDGGSSVPGLDTMTQAQMNAYIEEHELDVDQALLVDAKREAILAAIDAKETPDD